MSRATSSMCWLTRSPSGCAGHGRRRPSPAGVVDRLGPGVAVHELHVVIPPPPASGVLVIGPGDLVVPDDEGAVEGDSPPLGEEDHEFCRGPVHLFGEPLRVTDKALVLDADAARVVVPVACVPGDVLASHALGDPAVA